MSTDVTVLKHLMILNLDVSIWTARKRLSPKDFGGVTLPPEGLATLGSKRICNPDDLRIFGTLKSRAVAMLDRVGIRFLGGWGLPLDRAQDVLSELDKIKDEFTDARIHFLSDYDQNITNWLNQNKEWKDIIKHSIVGADYVSSRISFDWQMYQLAPPQESSLYDSLKGEVSQLGAKLLADIAKAADDAWKKCYEGKTKVSQKALSPLRTIYDKLNGLCCVEPCALPMAGVLETAFSTMPRKGFIEGADLLILQGVLALLRDPSAMIKHGQEIISGRSPEVILDTLLQGGEKKDDVPFDIGLLPVNQQAIESLGLW